MVDGLDETAAEEVAGRTSLAPDAQLGKYRLVRVLGAGGMGVVWVAHDPDLDRKVAIKLLHNEHAPDALRTRLLREARAMARLKHSNVLTVHEVASGSGRDYIVMELVDGTNLDAWLATKPGAADVWDALFAAGRGLAAAHAAGLVHRDFKPHNVLRGHDGRVLVTDFGLARGLADETLAGATRMSPSGDLALDATLTPDGDTPRRTDSVLDSPLTQTGAMIGTPAYMSTEQLAGRAADARSDQFAFCVTAWQALAGSRPFDGANLDELRHATNAGVAGVQAALPRDIRAVLGRGLDPDPAKRWPDMPALLAALDRARHVPRRRRFIAIAAFTFTLAGVLGVKLAVREPAPESASCEPEARAFDRTWSETRAMSAVAVSALDSSRERWLASYRRVCAQPKAAAFNQRLGCLLASRDFIVDMVPVIEKAPNLFVDSSVFRLLPSVDACEGASPPTPPQSPEAPALRTKIADIRLRALQLRGTPTTLRAAVDALVDEARATAWPPLVPEVLYLGAVTAHGMRQPDVARELVERAAVEAAAARHAAIEARARLEVVALDFDYSLNPRDAGELSRAVAEARGAIIAAGGSPLQLAHLDTFSARRAVLERHPEAAIEDLARIHALLLANDERRSEDVLKVLVRAYELRGRAGDLDAALAAVRTTMQRASAWGAELGPGFARSEQAFLAQIAGELDFRRGDLAAAHRDFVQAPSYELVRPITGSVRGPDGAPVEGALVVAWSGTLEADSTRVYAKYAATATTDHDGRFEIRARATAIVCEKGELRSRPQRIADGTALQLAPTHALAGTVTSLDAPPVDVEAFASMDVGGDHFVERAPVARDGSFELARLPDGITVAGVRDEEQTIRVTARGKLAIAWPALARLDLIVGGAQDDEPKVYVLRGKVTVRSRDELLALAGTASDVTTASALAIGDGDATDAGRAHYAPGDRHVVLSHVDAGWITACAIDGERTSCVPYEVKVANVVEHRHDDGTLRHWADTQAARIAF